MEDFEAVYRAHYHQVLRTTTAITHSPQAAEDLTQETFLRAMQAWPRHHADAPVGAWLHRIALNLAISRARYERLRSLPELLRRLGHPSLGADPQSAATHLDLLDALRRLPATQATALVLRYHAGYSNREIALALGIPERTVASRLIAAKRRLRSVLGDNPVSAMGTLLA